MRRKEFEVTSYEEMLTVAARCDVCRLALNDAAGPYVVPMNFGFEDKDGQLIIYFHCAKEGKKIDLIKENRQTASFEMDTAHELIEGKSACGYTYHYMSIIGNGMIEMPDDQEEKKHAFAQIMKQYTDKEDLPMNDALIEKACILRFVVSVWSCKVRQ